MADIKKITIDGDVFNGRVELTQAEYDVLPTSEKNNGIMYLITDAGGTAGGSGSVAWGSIIGTLSNQVDLATVLEGLVPLTGTTDMSGEFDIAGEDLFAGYENKLRGDSVYLHSPYSQNEYYDMTITPSIITLHSDNNGVSPSTHETVRLTTAGLSKDRNGDNTDFAVSGLTPITGLAITSATENKVDYAVTVADIRDGLAKQKIWAGYDVVSFPVGGAELFSFYLPAGCWEIEMAAMIIGANSSNMNMISLGQRGAGSYDCALTQAGSTSGTPVYHSTKTIVTRQVSTEFVVRAQSDTASSSYYNLFVTAQRLVDKQVAIESPF